MGNAADTNPKRVVVNACDGAFYNNPFIFFLHGKCLRGTGGQNDAAAIPALADGNTRASFAPLSAGKRPLRVITFVTTTATAPFST